MRWSELDAESIQLYYCTVIQMATGGWAGAGSNFGRWRSNLPLATLVSCLIASDSLYASSFSFISIAGVGGARVFIYFFIASPLPFAVFSFLFAHYSSALLRCNENSLVTRNISHESKIIVIIDVFKFNDLIFCAPKRPMCGPVRVCGHLPKWMGKEVEVGYSLFLFSLVFIQKRT